MGLIDQAVDALETEIGNLKLNARDAIDQMDADLSGAVYDTILTTKLGKVIKADIEWNDAAEAGPAVLAMIAMPFTYSISNGIALAFVSYAAIKICTGKFDSTSPAIWVIAILSIISFAVA